MSKKDKKSKLSLIIIASVAAVIITVTVLGLLTYFDTIEISFVNDIFVSIGLKDDDKNENKDSEAGTGHGFSEEDLKTPYEVTPPDADEYFKNNTTLKSEIKANESSAVRTESEVYDDFVERGFGNYPITTEYNMEGDYYKAEEIYLYSSEKHPMYQTYYVSGKGDVWVIFEINGAILANPLSYNEQKESGVQVMLSENDTITSYDSTANKFYVNIPNANILSVKKVDKIDAKTLENITYGELD